MDDKMLERRMELLNKSYERIPGKTDVSAVLNAIQEEQKPAKKKRSFIHWPYAASFMGVLLIASVLVLQTIGDDSGQVKDGDVNQAQMAPGEVSKALEEIENYYEVRKLQAIGSLGISEEAFAQTQMAADAEAYMAHTKGWAERGQFLSGQMDSMKENLDEMLMTPQQMLTGLTGKELIEEKAELWIKDFTESQGNLLPLYEKEISSFREEWEGSIVFGQLEGRDILLEREKDYSEELLMLVQGATANGISFIYSEEEDQFEAYADVKYLATMLSSAELPEVYMDVLRLKLFPASLQAGDIAVSRARAGGDLLLYERTLKNLPADSSFRHEFEMEYSTLFRVYVKGGATQSLFEDDGKLKEEAKENFEKMIELHPDTATVERLLPYYNKLKENNFYKPDGWDDFYLHEDL